MKKLLVMVAASVAFGAHADVFYVDSVNGKATVSAFSLPVSGLLLIFK